MEPQFILIVTEMVLEFLNKTISFNKEYSPKIKKC